MKDKHLVLFLIKHERGNGLTLVGMRPSLPMSADGSTADAEVIGGAGDSSEGGRHCITVMREECNRRG